jgi:hypothetical protein
VPPAHASYVEWELLGASAIMSCPTLNRINQSKTARIWMTHDLTNWPSGTVTCLILICTRSYPGKNISALQQNFVDLLWQYLKLPGKWLDKKWTKLEVLHLVAVAFGSWLSSPLLMPTHQRRKSVTVGVQKSYRSLSHMIVYTRNAKIDKDAFDRGVTRGKN